MRDIRSAEPHAEQSSAVGAGRAAPVERSVSTYHAPKGACDKSGLGLTEWLEYDAGRWRGLRGSPLRVVGLRMCRRASRNSAG